LRVTHFTAFNCPTAIQYLKTNFQEQFFWGIIKIRNRQNRDFFKGNLLFMITNLTTHQVRDVICIGTDKIRKPQNRDFFLELQHNNYNILALASFASLAI